MSDVGERVSSVVIPHLREQFARGLPYFLTGAGFSRDVKNILGLPIPAGAELKLELWSVCFPGQAFEEGNSLQDLYEEAFVRHRGELTTRLTSALTAEADSIPEWYRLFFRFPWAGGYTLNIDDLAAATGQKFQLPRKIVEVSARSPVSTPGTPRTSSDTLEIVHLNGTIQDIPDRVTFPVTQYAERLAVPDPWYFRLTGELISRPFVFIGSFHYWLQRGSLEVEDGSDLSLAKNFLDQARGLAPDDPLVENEYAYLQFARALSNVSAVEAPELVKDATDSLLDLIERRRYGGEYPDHVLGSQGLAWARRGIRRGEEKERFMLMLVATVEQGVQRFPAVAALKKLLQDLKKEHLTSAS
jgi:hypothetical protein